MKSYLHFLFLVTLFGVTFLFLFSFSVCGFTHSLSFPCIFSCCIFLPGGCLLCILVDFLIWRATNTHAVRDRGLPLILFTFFSFCLYLYLLSFYCLLCVWLCLVSGWCWVGHFLLFVCLVGLGLCLPCHLAVLVL
jgi:hypothetical protein